jgi:hypothetical protein
MRKIKMSDLPILKSGDICTVSNGRKVVIIDDVCYFLGKHSVTYSHIGYLVNTYEINKVEREVGASISWNDVKKRSVCKLLERLMPDEYKTNESAYKTIWEAPTKDETEITSIREEMKKLNERLKLIEIKSDNIIKEGDFVTILKSKNAYHVTGEVCKVWGVDLGSNTVVCPDDSGGSVTYLMEEVEKR